MGEIVSKVSLMSARLASAVENIRQQMAAQGQQLDSSFMKSQILPHFISGLQDIQSTILLKHEVEPEELEEAVTTYIDEGDQELFEMSMKVKKCFNQFGGELRIDEDEEEDDEDNDRTLSLEDLLEILRKLSDVLNEKTEEFIVDFIEQYGQPDTTEKAEEFQQGMLELSSQ